MLVISLFMLVIKGQGFFLRHKSCNELINEFEKILDIHRPVAFFLDYFLLQDAVIFILLLYFLDNSLTIGATSPIVLSIISDSLISIADFSAELS